MCMMNNHLVGEYGIPCGNCPEYLNTCKPVIVGGFVFGECDICYCEFCSYHERCAGMTLACHSEQEESEG